MFNIFKKSKRERDVYREKNINSSSNNNKVMKRIDVKEILAEIAREVAKKLNNGDNEVEISIAYLIEKYNLGMSSAYNLLKVLEQKFKSLNLKVKRHSGTLIISKDEHE